MATRLNSFTKTGVALASAAAVVAATPVVTPSLSLPTLPTPPALSQAQYELSNFATFIDYLTDPNIIAYALFTGWGGAIGPINVDPEEPVVDTFAPFCNYDCTINGPSGVAYMLLDALFNGVEGTNTWPKSAVNYFFEAGLGIGLQYIVQQPFQPGVENPKYDPTQPIGPDNEPYLTPPGPLANQVIFDAIALAWQGPVALTTILLQVVAPVTISVVGAVPVVGPLAAGGLSAYFYGYANELSGITAPAGLSGVLAYVTDYLTQAIVNIGDVLPTAATPATTLAAAALPSLRGAAAVAEPEVATVSAPAVVEPVTTGDDNAAVEEPADDVAVSPVDEASSSEEPTPVDEAPAEAEDVTDVDEAEPVTPVEVPADVADEVTESAPAEAAPAPVKAPKRPVRSAVERIAKSVQSALGGTAKADASDAGSADAGSTDAPADSE